jgi:biotin operon repressor
MKTTRELAERLGCSMTTIRKTMKSLKQEPVKTGKGFQYTLKSVDVLIKHYEKYNELTKRFSSNYKTVTTAELMYETLKIELANHNESFNELNEKLGEIIKLLGGESEPEVPHIEETPAEL